MTASDVSIARTSSTLSWLVLVTGALARGMMGIEGAPFALGPGWRCNAGRGR